MKKPVPVPRRGVSGRRNPNGSPGGRAVAARRRDRDATSMLTTAGLAASATSAKLLGNAPAGRIDGVARGPGAGSARTTGTGADTAGAGVSDPVTMAPTRKPTVAVSPAVNQANCRVISPL